MTNTSPAGSAQPSTPSADPTLGAQATRGLAWMTAQTFLAKLAAIVAQTILAWLLLEQDFALVALAMAIAAFPSLLQQIGIREVLIQKHAEFDRWASPAFWLSGAVGLATALAIAASGPIAAHLYGEPKLIPLTLILAAAAPFNSLCTVPLARLQFMMRHRAVATISSALALANPALSVLFAYLKWGAYSFLVPLALTAVLRLILFGLAARFVPRPRPETSFWPPMLLSGMHLMAARAMGLFIGQGDYMVLGLVYLNNDAVLGIYYFAFNLSMQTVVLLVPNLDGVLLPTLSRLQGEPERQRASFILIARALAFFAFFACFLQASLAHPGIHAIIAPRWYPSIPVVQILSVGMAFRTAGWVMHSLIPAQGRFRTYTLIHVVGAVVFLLFVLAGALLGKHYFGGAVAVAAAVSLYFAAEAPIALYIAMRPLHGRWRDIAYILARPILLATASVGVASCLGALVPPVAAQHWIRLAVIPFVAVGLFVPLARWLVPELWEALRIRFAVAFKRRGAQAG